MIYILLAIYLLGLAVNVYLYGRVIIEIKDKKYLPKLILALIFWPVYYLIIAWRMW